MGLLLISLLAQITGAVFFFLDWNQYPQTKPTPAPGFKPPETAPKRGGNPAQMPLNPELTEMEIPTFIRRQMD